MNSIDRVTDSLFERLYNGPDHYSCAVGAYNSAYFALEYQGQHWPREDVLENCEMDYHNIIEALVYIINNPIVVRPLVREYDKHFDYN